MNKTELSERLAEKCDLSKAKAAEVVGCIFDTAPGQGIIAIELDGPDETIGRAIIWLREQGVTVEPIEKNVIE